MDWQETAPTPPPAPAALQQHPRYAGACAALGLGIRALTLPAPGGPAATVLLLTRRWPVLGPAALVTRGPVWAPGLGEGEMRAAERALLSRLRRDHRVAAIAPDRRGGRDPLDRSGWLAVLTPAHHAMLDLTGPAAAIRGRQSAKWRNRLVRAEAAGLALSDAPLPPDRGHWLLRTEAAQRRRRGYAGLPPDFAAAYAHAGGRRATRLFEATARRRVAAAMLFLVHPPAATYFIGWTGPQGRETNAHNLLLWRACLWLKDQGIATVDLGLLDTEAAPGLARFKLGAGAEAVATGATRLSAPGTRLAAVLQSPFRAADPQVSRSVVKASG